MTRFFMCVLLLFYFSSLCYSEIPSFSLLQTSDGEYEPYEDDEFHPALHQVRRSEVLFFGSLPISFLYANLGIMAYGSASGHSMEGNEKSIAIISSAVVLSLCVVLADYLIGRVGKKAK